MPVAWDIWSVAAEGQEAIARRTMARFKSIVRYARSHSRYYRDHYRELPPEDPASVQIPPMTRSALMSRFDEWVTDPEVTQETLSAFVADPERAGQPYLGRYAVWTSSGTTGEPGVFVHDAGALAVYDALEILRLGRGLLGNGFPGHVCDPSWRYAMVAATGGHFAGVASVGRMRYLAPALAERMRVFSILEPLPSVIKALNEYQPTFLATYPSMANLLAAEQEGGRLAIKPSTLWLGGETLTAACRAQVKRGFDCTVLEEYGASECMSIACECHYGSLHLNSDWALIEPVDRDYRPVPPGEISHTVLLTNLANRVQPIIRYDLGDSIVISPELCACGSPFPVLRVQGRNDDVVCLRDGRGQEVRLLPLALTTVLEDLTGVHWFQIVQTGARSLSVRLEPFGHGAQKGIWDSVVRAMTHYLQTQGLSEVTITRDRTQPEHHGRSGKLRRVVVNAGVNVRSAPGASSGSESSG